MRKPKRCRNCKSTKIREIDGRWVCWYCGEVLGPAPAGKES